MQLNQTEQEYIKSLWDDWIDNKTVMAKMVIDKFQLDKNPESLRKTVRRIIERHMDDQHRWNAMNSYAKQEETSAKNIRLWWHKTELADWSKVSMLIKNNPGEDALKELKDDILQTISDVVEWIGIEKLPMPKIQKNEYALKVTISDTHVWLDPNPHWNGLFQYEYNSQLFLDGLGNVALQIVKEYTTYWAFDVVVLQDLWDGLDWRNWLTTRWWHSLDQNMSNKEAFETYVRGKIMLIKRIISSWITDKIIVRDVCNDNHSWDFGKIANFTVSEIINELYGEWVVEFQRLERFMEHFIYGDHCFIVTHWKDDQHMRWWLPIVLNDKTIKFVSDYIEHYGIDSKHIHVEKWDLHQLWFQKTKRFDYRNYMSFAPGSAWVSHNFWDSYSGYSIDIIQKHGCNVSHTDYFIDYKKK